CRQSRARCIDSTSVGPMLVGRGARPQPPLRRRDSAPESEAGVAGRGAMAIEDRRGGLSQYARPFSLIPPPRDRQFRTAQLKAERAKRRAEQRRAAALENG